MTVYRCKVCGYLHVGEAPEVCPMCQAKKVAFAEYEVPDLKGTKTFENLQAAFGGESMANRKYTLYKQIAEQEGASEEVLEAFKRPLDEETAHALSHLVYMKAFGTTAENLVEAAAGERYEHEEMYREFAQTAQDEGYPELAHYFKWVGKFEDEHMQGYERAAQDLDR